MTFNVLQAFPIKRVRHFGTSHEYIYHGIFTSQTAFEEHMKHDYGVFWKYKLHRLVKRPDGHYDVWLMEEE